VERVFIVHHQHSLGIDGHCIRCSTTEEGIKKIFREILFTLIEESDYSKEEINKMIEERAFEDELYWAELEVE